jgi:hypothetical protein
VPERTLEAERRYELHVQNGVPCSVSRHQQQQLAKAWTCSAAKPAPGAPVLGGDEQQLITKLYCAKTPIHGDVKAASGEPPGAGPGAEDLDGQADRSGRRSVCEDAFFRDHQGHVIE